MRSCVNEGISCDNCGNDAGLEHLPAYPGGRFCKVCAEALCDWERREQARPAPVPGSPQSDPRQTRPGNRK